ncbi:sugar ABC transporter substrate-binding protein [Capsulimonas corticalis]|uniref:Sugar ABC transporter substrate-binding protein n=2 Tax=Capsulimonas corticalis TaxID=2219043 RepID=A0A402CY91_9BACT|nr:sugar ABC transporter substrate-binding protein [Capsulimonas corticalis]
MVLAGSIAIAMLAGCNKGNETASPPAPGAPTAPSATPSGGAVPLAFVTNNASDYWTIAHKGVDAASKELPNVNVQFVMPADGTAATQKSDVDDLLAKGVKGIAISPVDPNNQIQMLNDVAKKTILITQDSDAATSDRVCYIGTDNHAAGLMAGGLIKEAIPQGGKIMMFVGARDAQNAKDRETGIRDALKGSNITVVDVRTDDADHAKAKSNVADALVKTPDLACLVGLWSYNGPAILNAVKDAHKVGQVKIVCFDEEDETLAGVKDGSIYATVVQQPYQFGYQGVKLLNDLVAGKKDGIPAGKQIFIPTQAIKKDNVDDFQVKLNKLRGR